MRTKKYLLVLLIAIGQKVYSQHSSDTAALVKEFTKVMAFTTQPYLYYTTVTKMDAIPLLNDKDTISANGVFYKNNNTMYCNTTKDEMYVDDSLMVQINNDNKTIWISKVDASNKGKLNMLPEATAKMLDMMQRNYTISKSKNEDGFSKISFETKKPPYSNSVTSAAVVLEYWEQTQWPKSITMEMSMKQPANEEMITAIKNEGVDENKLLQKIDGVNYLVTMQRIQIQFANIENRKEKVLQIPSCKEKITYNETTGEYTGKGIYGEYVITKTF